jgi:O-6-methylguanine DNA methyltransferase
MKVLEEVSKIPFGKTLTYKQVARKVGHPNAYRAVGTVLKKNPYPLIIPCHRVIKSDGDIGKYALGKELKRELIDFEKRIKKRIKCK